PRLVAAPGSGRPGSVFVLSTTPVPMGRSMPGLSTSGTRRLNDGRTCERKRPDDRPAKRQRAAGRRGRLRVHQPRGAVGGSDVSPRPAGRWASDRGRLAARGTVAVAAGLAGSACASSFGAPAGGTDQGADVHR